MELYDFAFKDGIFQLFAACAVHSLAIHAGINMAFTTILLPHIMPGNNSAILPMDTLTYNAYNDSATSWDDISVDKDEATWIASLVTITTPIGSMLAGALMDRFGRKRICIFTTLPLVLAWTVAAATTSHVYFLYISRTLAGVGAGLSTVALVYVSETSHASLRPMLLSLNSAFVSFGILLTTLLGHIMPWRGVACSCAILAAISLISIVLLPESPVWLNNMCRWDDNRRDRLMLKSLKKLYPKPEQCQIEHRKLIQSRIRVVDTLIKPLTDRSETTDTARRAAWRPVILLLGLFFLQQFSGGYLVIFYAIQIFKAAGEMEVDEWTNLIVLGVIRFVMAIASTFLAKRFGRRQLLMSSAAGMAATMFVASAAILIPTTLSSPTLQVVCILAFVFFSSFGFLVIPWTLIGELLPHRLRGKGSGLIISYAYLLMFITVKLFMYVLDFGLGYMFLFFAGISLSSIVYVYYFIPETLGRSFEEIEKILGL